MTFCDLNSDRHRSVSAPVFCRCCYYAAEGHGRECRIVSCVSFGGGGSVCLFFIGLKCRV